MNQDEAKGFVAGDEAIDARELREDPGFSQADWRRLAFLRWRYRTGRLTEWPEGKPDRESPRHMG
jgi:hypothetical protein